MNNFKTTAIKNLKTATTGTTAESLPRSGHVNEVCKEWLVREDGALAYKLQSQEINDFYKGNRYRNAVVREDFPTALHEQIKESENAQRQKDAYRKRLGELEEHDKQIAKEIADKLERDLQEQQQKELQDSELVAQQMQEIYVNLPPVPPPSARDKSRPPPRPAKASTQQQQQKTCEAANSSARQSSHSQKHFDLQPTQFQSPLQLQQQHFSNTDNYVGLTLLPHTVELPAISSRQQQQMPQAHNHPAFVKLSPEKYDQLIGNDLLQAKGTGATAAAERHMQQHAEDIELYVDPCEYACLREIGLPIAEIKEMSKKLKQEQKDELLARRLQALESNDSVHQEERDRMLAIEAQDKELARMLQDREKAKAKRAKEKARLRKSQQKEATTSGSLCGTTSCGPLMSMPQDCISSNTSTNKHSTAAKTQHTNHPREDQAGIDVEAYSNPIDVINNSLRMQNGTLTNGSLGRESIGSGTHRPPSHVHRDDDIYTLPVDSCRPAQTRPVSLHAAAETVQQLQTNAMSRSEHYGNELLDSHNDQDVAPHLKYSKSGNFDQNSSPTPPYMPIQGTRRSNSSEDRKKKSKDNKCTHQ